MINGARVIVYSKNAGVVCDALTLQAWGRPTRLGLPGGETLALYQPRHESP
jgi:hypothetical protein